MTIGSIPHACCAVGTRCNHHPVVGRENSINNIISVSLKDPDRTGSDRSPKSGSMICTAGQDVPSIGRKCGIIQSTAVSLEDGQQAPSGTVPYPGRMVKAAG